MLAVHCAIADQFGGEATDEFAALMDADHGEVLREGEFGDEHVALEDKLITSCLKGYVGAEREQVLRHTQQYLLRK